VLYQGKPYYCSTRAGMTVLQPREDSVHLYPLLQFRIDERSDIKPEHVDVKYRDSAFEAFQVPLGYVPTTKHAIPGFSGLRSDLYASRVPSRVSSYGVHVDNVAISSKSTGSIGENRNIFYSPAFAACIKGEYDNFQTALDTVTKMEKEVVAFDRDYAVQNDGSLVYLLMRGSIIAVKRLTDEKFLPSNARRYEMDYEYLVETHGDQGLKINV
jgi:hypothetical protein